MNALLRTLAALLLAGSALARAATNPATGAEPFTAKELAQGYREQVILARPHAAHRATVDGAEAREGVRVRTKFARFRDLRVIELDATDSADAAIARLQATGRYEFVEPDRLRHLDATPNDTAFATQWAMNNTGQSGGIPGADLKALAAWDILHDAPNVIIAVVDTGVNLNHQDITANLWRNPVPTVGDINGANFVGGRGALVSGNPTDDAGHGTHIAGTIGALGNNNLAVTGVAWKVQLMAVKVFPATGAGSVSEIAAGVHYAITHGAQIINASYGETGSSGFSQTELAAVTEARDAGVIFVAAAGNGTANLDVARHYPASFPLDNIVTVGATTRSETVATFSNYGTAVDLLAPGQDIVSLLYSNNTGTTTLSGTSMAAPHVSGALALLKAQFPTDTYRQLINRLLRGTDPIARYAGKAQNGGRLNLFGALTTTSNRPFNDDFTTRARLSGDNFLVRSSNVGATVESGGEPAHAGSPASASLWWEWTPTTTEVVRLTTTGSAFDTVLAIYTGSSPNALTLVAANDDDGASPTSRIDFTAQAGVTYQIAVDGKNGTTGLALLNLGSVPANDAFSAPVTLSGQSASATATNANCTRETGEPRILGFAGGTSLWYRWTAPRSGQFQVAATSNDFDPLLAVYSGTALNALTLVASSDNTGTSNSQTASLCSIIATAGTTYLLTVDSKSTSSLGQFTITVNDSLWQASTGTATVTGSSLTGAPAVAPDGTIYIGSTDRSLYAFSPGGTPLWSYPTGGLIDTCSPAIGADGTIYFGSNDGKLYALAPDGVTLRWSHTFPSAGVSNSPTLATDGTIYVKPSDGLLYALNPADGTTKWTRDVKGLLSYGSAAVAPDGTIYQGSEDKNLYAINPADGTVKWRFLADNDIYTAPAIDAAGNIYFSVLNSGKLYSVTPAGTPRWTYSGAALGSSSSPCLSADGSTVYYGGYDRKLHAIDSATGAVRWTYLLGDEVRASSPAVDANGVIYIGCYDFKLYAINPDGTLKRTWATGNWIRSCPALSGTSLYVGSNDNKLYAFDLGASVSGGPWPQYRANPRRLGRAISDTFAITAAPRSQTAIVSLPLTLDVIATGPSAISYQWSKDGAAIAGATSSTYTVTAATTATAGSYTVKISSAQGTLTSTPAIVTVEPLNPGRLTNLSVRTTAGTGAQTLTVGFVVSAGAAKPLLVRGIGPSLTQFGVTGVLADPKISLLSGTQQLITENDDWSSDSAAGAITAAAAARVGAFPLVPGTKDAAFIWPLSAGSATVQLTGGGTTGIALAELYDTDPTPAGAQTLVAVSRLINVSARAQVTTGGGILIAGFVLNGNVSKQILLRAVGPSLSQFNVTGRLADPKLEVFDANSKSIAVNDDWRGDTVLRTAFTSVGAFGLNSSTSLDAVLLVTLAPGSYTAQVSGVSGATGIALVEIYEVP
ncbi:MAG: hypothetical protein EXS32_03650 [Opitutus sp.]|nr:hypothetical protein [Opitutus sp.]